MKTPTPLEIKGLIAMFCMFFALFGGLLVYLTMDKVNIAKRWFEDSLLGIYNPGMRIEMHEAAVAKAQKRYKRLLFQLWFWALFALVFFIGGVYVVIFG